MSITLFGSCSSALNPCPCGYYGSALHILYFPKIPLPLLDRIDLQIEMPHLSFDEMQNQKQKQNVAFSSSIKKTIKLVKPMIFYSYLLAFSKHIEF